MGSKPESRMEKILKEVEEVVSQPFQQVKFPKHWKKRRIIEEIKKNLKRAKSKRAYEQTYQYLYQLGKRQHIPKIRSAFEQHHRVLATKIHILAKGRRWIIPHLRRVTTDKFKNVSNKEIPLIAESIVRKVLDGARTNVGEDLRDISYPAVDPQQVAVMSHDPQPSTTQSERSLWTDDAPEDDPFRLTVEEVTRLADSLTENDWTTWNFEEGSRS